MTKRSDFIKDEINEMLKYKWIESEKAGHDLGDVAIREWIIKYASSYREYWEKEHGKVE